MGKHNKDNDKDNNQINDGVTTGTNMGEITQKDVEIHDPEENK